jgi:signal transduction histidine kinase
VRPQRSSRQYSFLAATTRVFGFVALLVAGVLSKDATALLATLSIGCVWLAATAAERLPVPGLLLVAAEAGLVGVAAALSMSHSFQTLTALAFPPFTAALRRGPRGAMTSLAGELVALVGTSLVAYGGFTQMAASSAFTWIIFSLGLGLIGSFIHVGVMSEPDPLDSYRNAQRLIRELIGLSGQLSQGLEPVTLAASIASAVHDELPVRGVVVHVSRGELLTPIISDHYADPDELAEVESLAARAWRERRIQVDAHAFALPLLSVAGPVAVISGFLSRGLDPVAIGLHQTLGELAYRLEPDSVHLDTALLFAAFRDAATAEERRRLAREMHDGVAQEMASLGYLVDDMIAEAAHESSAPEQALRLQVLRERLSAVVGEVRRSVQTLRTSVGENQSLGMAIGSLARHLTASSGIPIQVTLDESTQRLRPEVEAELLRIAQEAMTNAVRHAEATLIEVQCTVSPPGAEIVVSDDGHGIRGRRSDSHGLEIMAERARLIQGSLEVESRTPTGTVLSVRVGGLAEPPASSLPGVPKAAASARALPS